MRSPEAAAGELRPLVRLVSNLAGDEATGRELLAHLALHLLYLYNKVGRPGPLTKPDPCTRTP